MDAEMELQQTIYDTLLAQIQFGAFQYKDSLPTAAVLSEFFHVSVDTVQLAYRRLKKEGYISLSRNVGAKVMVAYSDAEIEQYIQAYFSRRKDALLDLSGAIQPLLCRLQLFSLKHTSGETFDNIERFYEKHAQQPYAMWHYYEQKYAALGNAILMRLAWQVFLFFQVPFFSAAEYKQNLSDAKKRVYEHIELCRRKDWQVLQGVLDFDYNGLCASLHLFYRERITQQASGRQSAFRWTSYKKPGQLCYSLAMELLIGISCGVYPAGCLLPTRERLSAEKGVSVSTVRRAVGLLCDIGAVKTDRPYGMRVLPILESVHNCDFTQPAIRQRLIGMAECLQIFALSCGAVAELTLRSLDADSIGHWKQRFSVLLDSSHYDVLPYVVLELIVNSVPNKTIQTVYAELMQQLFWGNPLRGMKGNLETTNALLKPYLTDMLTCLENKDVPGFCSRLEKFMIYELRDSRDHLLQVGIQEAAAILVPQKDEF